MPNWTPDHSMILSLLLDVVVGTKEEITIRQDYCRLHDCLASTLHQQNNYFTGSKAEGLELPGSDHDFMIDINENHHMEVIQLIDEYPNIFPLSLSVFLMCTQNVPPGFALLQYLQNVPHTMIKPCLQESLKKMDGSQYLSSDFFVDKHKMFSSHLKGGVKSKRQGPSLETWTEYDNTSDSGSDNVLSIHCKFWPNECIEWIHRTRNFDWPTPHAISSIVEFGCHLVPIGHPHSDTKPMEWRISFSIAERTLVWSFNHVQMQCYAIMKIILKEFIKVRCSPQNQVLCSYFIKTFLFWKYEANDLNFWRTDNLRGCIKYLVSEFSQCLRKGVLRHYFIPRFNLLSVKLTRAAQTELLQLFDIIIESDISILKDCPTLQNVWSEFLQALQNNENIIIKVKRRNYLKNDECMIRLSASVEGNYVKELEHNPCIYKAILSKILNVFCKTTLKRIVMGQFILKLIMSLLKNNCAAGNKGCYQLHRTAQNDTLSFDISTCKLWCAILFYMRGDFLSTLDIVNQVLSCIPPFSIDEYKVKAGSNEREQLYVEMFLNSDATILQRARKAWMLSLYFTKYMSHSMPFGIQIELYFCDIDVSLSPFTCAYYLQFLCYHGMQQYDRRDRTLQQFIEYLCSPEQSHLQISTTIIAGHYLCIEYLFNTIQGAEGQHPFSTLNLAGHCLLLAGKRDQARVMFNISYAISQGHPPYDKYNSALWYLQNCF